ncbi:hypothetical protein WA158_007138 [Blastocystis sp. Blastoise]
MRISVVIHTQADSEPVERYLQKEVTKVMSDDALVKAIDIQLIPFGTCEYYEKKKMGKCPVKTELKAILWQWCAITKYGVAQSFPFYKCIQEHNRDKLLWTWGFKCSFNSNFDFKGYMKPCVARGMEVMEEIYNAKKASYPRHIKETPLVLIEDEVCPDGCPNLKKQICDHFPKDDKPKSEEDVPAIPAAESTDSAQSSSQLTTLPPRLIVEDKYRTKVQVFYSSFGNEIIPFLNVITGNYLSNNELEPYVDFDLIPFGLMTITDNEMTCPGGNKECNNNQLLVCIKSLYDDPRLYIPTMLCLQTKGYAMGSNILKCAGSQEFKDIAKCISDEEGKKLIQAAGDATKTAFPSGIPRVPIVLIDGKESPSASGDFDIMLQNIIKEKLMTLSPKPAFYDTLATVTSVSTPAIAPSNDTPAPSTDTTVSNTPSTQQTTSTESSSTSGNTSTDTTTTTSSSSSQSTSSITPDISSTSSSTTTSDIIKGTVETNDVKEQNISKSTESTITKDQSNDTPNTDSSSTTSTSSSNIESKSEPKPMGDIEPIRSTSLRGSKKSLNDDDDDDDDDNEERQLRREKQGRVIHFDSKPKEEEKKVEVVNTKTVESIDTTKKDTIEAPKDVIRRIKTRGRGTYDDDDDDDDDTTLDIGSMGGKSFDFKDLSIKDEKKLAEIETKKKEDKTVMYKKDRRPVVYIRQGKVEQVISSASGTSVSTDNDVTQGVTSGVFEASLINTKTNIPIEANATLLLGPLRTPLRVYVLFDLLGADLLPFLIQFNPFIQPSMQPYYRIDFLPVLSTYTTPLNEIRCHNNEDSKCNAIYRYYCVLKNVSSTLEKYLMLVCLMKGSRSILDNINTCSQELNIQISITDVLLCSETDEMNNHIYYSLAIRDKYFEGFPFDTYMYIINHNVYLNTPKFFMYTLCRHFYGLLPPTCEGPDRVLPIENYMDKLKEKDMQLTLIRKEKIRIDLYIDIACEISNFFISNTVTWLMKHQEGVSYIDMYLHPTGTISLTKNGTVDCTENINVCVINQAITCVSTLYTDLNVQWALLRCIISYGLTALDHLEDCSDAYLVDVTTIYDCVNSGKGLLLLQKELELFTARQTTVVYYPYLYVDTLPIDKYYDLFTYVCRKAWKTPEWCKQPPAIPDETLQCRAKLYKNFVF